MPSTGPKNKSSTRASDLERVSSHRPLVGVVCRISRSGKRRGRSIRRWQLLGCNVLDFLTSPRPDHYPAELKLHANTAVGFSVGTTFVRSYVARPRVPTLEQVASTNMPPHTPAISSAPPISAPSAADQ